MFYNNNDNYMQDLYFYNQIPNGTYNPYMNQISNNQNPYIANGMVQNNMNSMMPNNMNGMMANNMMQNGMYPNQNLNNLYPSLYRVMMPVISRVISSNNIQFLNEDTLNNMVDTVFNIVDGQIDYDDNNMSERNVQTESTVTQNTSSTSNNSGSASRTTDSRQTTNSQTTSSRSNRNDKLLRDIIKILILRELLSRNQNFTNSQMFNQTSYYPANQCNMNY